MSRHNKLIKRLRDKALLYSSDPLFEEAANALQEEIQAHETTRAQRNEGNTYVNQLRGNVRGLEAKIKRIEEGNPMERKKDCILCMSDGYSGMIVAGMVLDICHKLGVERVMRALCDIHMQEHKKLADTIDIEMSLHHSQE
jgi:hypothetical protein